MLTDTRSLKKIFFVYFFLAMLVFTVAEAFFLVVENRGYSLVAVRGFLISVTSLTVEPGL